MITIIKEYLPLIVLGFNVAMFVVIKFNDMHHLQLRFDELKKSIENMDKKLDLNAERISKIEGTCKANHG
jgi:prefoldin subunit 5